MPEWVIEIAYRGGPYALVLPLAYVVVKLFRENSRIRDQHRAEMNTLHADCARTLAEVQAARVEEMAEVQAARVEEMGRVTTAAIALRETAEKLEQSFQRRR